MKGVATEVILAVGVLIAVGVTLLQLRGIYVAQQQLAQEEVVSVFAKDLESVIDKAIATTGNAAFVYYPSIMQYRIDIKSNTVSILDKIFNESATFTKSAPGIVDNSFEGCEKIFVTKQNEKIILMCKCFELGEACSNSLLCCSGYCNPNSNECEEAPVCPSDRICAGAPESEKDSLGKDCCPTDAPICTSGHCCPADEPRWCENTVSGSSRCMSNQDFNDPNVCKKAEFKLIFVPVNYQPNDSDFLDRVNQYKSNLLSKTKLGQCSDMIETIIVDQTLPLSRCDANSIFTFADNWYASKYGAALPPCNYQGAVMVCKYRIYGIDSSSQNYGSCGCAHVPDFYSGVAWIGGGCGRDVAAVTHESGHTFGTCDEYGYDYWTSENYQHPLGHCPNSFPTNECDQCTGVCCRGRSVSGGYCIMGRAGVSHPAFCDECYSAIDDYISNYLKLC